MNRRANLNSASSKQLALPFGGIGGLLPFAVRRASLQLAARRQLLALELAPGLASQQYLEDVALLLHMRRCARKQGNAAAFAATPDGRRAHAIIHSLVTRIAAEQIQLCG